MSNLALNLVGTARRIPNRKAAITDDAAMTYAELAAAASRLATLLDREGIEVGDRVGVMLQNIAASAQQKTSGVESVFTLTYEIDGEERPACVADVIVLYP